MMCPCKDCQDRQAECHSRCKAYSSWKKKHDLARQIRNNVGDGKTYLDNPYRRNYTDAW